MRVQVGDCGHGITVGNYLACDSLRRFDRYVHIWHPYQDGKWHCQAMASRQDEAPRDLFVEYSDGASLETMVGVTPFTVARFIGITPAVLIHCAHGTYRGPTLAVLALVARGVEILDALDRVNRACWDGYEARQVPFLNPIPIREIATVPERRRLEARTGERESATE